MKTQNLDKGQNMLKAKSISIIASIAIVGSLGLSGCGGSSSNATSPGVTQTNQNTTAQKIGTSVITGKVQLDTTPTNRTVKSTTDATSEIVAYNMNDNTQYTTTSDKSGNYTLSGLTEGEYQVVASSSRTTLRSVRKVSVKRDTRQTVNVVLQAAGSIKGKILYTSGSTSMTVYIPGTSYMSTVDSDGNFELVNVPVGDVTLFFTNPDYNDGYNSTTYYTRNVSVKAGKVTSLPSVNPFVTTVTRFNGLQSGSSLELRYMGIRVMFNRNIDTTYMKSRITLTNANGDKFPVALGIGYGDSDALEPGSDNHILVESKDVLPAGTYTLNIATQEPYSKTFTIDNKLAVWEDSDLDGGMYKRDIGLAFPGTVPTDINTSEITVTGNDGTTFTPTLKELKDSPDSIGLAGNFKTGVKYAISFTGDLATKYPDGIFYVGTNGDQISLNGIYIDGTNINYISPYNGSTNVQLVNNSIGFGLSHSEAIDLSTVKATLDGKEYTIKNGGLLTDSNNYNHNYWDDGQYRSFSLKGADLEYAKDYNLTVTAKDVLGADINKTSSFTTMTPMTVGMLPYTQGDYNDMLDNFDDYAPLKAYFNAPVDEKSGNIQLHDDTNDKVVGTSPVFNEGYGSSYAPYSNDTSTQYHVGFSAEELLPNTTYTMTVTGFKAHGYTVADANTTFTTPPRQFVYASVANGSYENASILQNRLSFNFYGKLTDAEKADLVKNLTITSFNMAMPTDKSHPTPLALWDTDAKYGERLYLSFTIDDDSSYELKFAGTTASKLHIPNSKLTFMTTKPGDSQYTGNINKVNVIDNMYVGVDAINPEVGYNDGNLSALVYQAKGFVNVDIPTKMYDGSCDYNDNNASEIYSWLSGTDLNITNASASSTYTWHNSYYDENNQYHSSFNSCDKIYKANFTVKTDNNSSVTLNIPQSALGTDFTANDLTRTLDVHMSDPAGYDVQEYGSQFQVHFNSPVLMPDLNITTNPDGIYQGASSEGNRYYDANTTYYTKGVDFTFDASEYSMFEYTMQGKVSYYDIATHTVKKDAIDINKTGIVFTQPDLTPLELKEGPMADASNEIALLFNSTIDIDSVVTKDENGAVTSSAFELIDNDDNSTISITDARDGYNGTYDSDTGMNIYPLELTTAEDLNTSKTYTLKQTQAIKKLGSTQSLEAGSIDTEVDLSELTK